MRQPINPGPANANGHAWSLGELVVRLVSPSPHATAAAPHARAPVSVGRLLGFFVIASAPALGVGLWNLGFQTARAMAVMENAPMGWRGAVLGVLGVPISAESVIGCIVVGLLYFLPLLITALVVGSFWELAFATRRRRPVDPGWLMSSWLFVLLLPASLPLWVAALGMSFGAVLGMHIFGGTGKYIVSPSLLGVLFVYLGYPEMLVGDTVFVPVAGFTASSTWAVVAEGETGIAWIEVFVGREISALGTGSALACVLGAVLLVFVGAASRRTLLGALGGLVITTLLFNAAGSEDPAWLMPWHWQLALGSFAFGAAFLATDPTTSPLTPAGRWLHGALIGSLTVTMRVANPVHPDGALFAILVAGLAAPVIDYFVLRTSLSRWRRR